jgi:hypothetical protein
MMQGRLAPTRRLRAAVAGALLVVAAGSAGAQAVPDRGALPLGAPEVEARPIMPTGEDPGTASDLGTWAIGWSCSGTSGQGSAWP